MLLNIIKTDVQYPYVIYLSANIEVMKGSKRGLFAKIS